MPLPTLHDVHVDAVMTSISISYKNENYMAEQVFARIPVTKKSDYYYTFPKQSWQRNPVAQRAPGTIAERAEYDLTTSTYNCDTWAIAKVVPDEVRENADAPLRPDVEAAEFVTDALLRAEELRVARITTGGSGLWSYSSSPTTQWSSDVSDPWGDIDAAVNGVVSSIGRTPNVAIFSWDVWRHLRQHPDFLDRVKYTRPGGRVDPGDLVDWFGFSKVLIGTQLWDSAMEGQTASPAYIWGDQMWMGYVPPAPSLRTPAAGYVLEWKTRKIARFREDQRYQDVFEASHSTDEVIAASDAGAVLYNCV